ncbi:MAG: glutaredoxin [Candidatus Thalassarchaeaceae archaeon]|nr:glutaredoxin [Candidatus Thalassarchaeaceae archaeon]
MKKGAVSLSQLREIILGTETDFLVFTQTICPYCSLAFRVLKSKELSFTDVNLDYHDGLRQAVVRQTGHRTVPAVFDLRGEEPVFVGGSDNLLDYL